MQPVLKTIKHATRHVGAGRNVNLYTLGRNALPYYLFPSGFSFSPLTIFLSINSTCNMKCKMCDIGQRNVESSFYRNLRPGSGNAELDFERLKEVVTEVGNYSPKPRISVTTTEPFLYKRLFDLAKYVTASKMEFQVTTNGSLLEAHIDDIFASGLQELAVSIDGKGELHDSIRGMKGLYENIKTSLEQIKDRKAKEMVNRPRISLAVTVSNYNYDRLSELVEDLDESLYDRIIISHMNFINQSMVNEHNSNFLFMGKAEMAGLPGETNNYKVDVRVLHEQIRYIKQHYSKTEFAPDYTMQNLEIFYNNPSEFIWDNRCYIPWFVMEILANGDVIALTRCIHVKMGNIYEKSITDIWNGSEYRRFRMLLMKYKRFPICRRCRGIL